MKPRISVLTLGVTDLEKSVAFFGTGLDYRQKELSEKNLNMVLSHFLTYKVV